MDKELTKLYKEAVERAYQAAVAKAFDVLIDNLVTEASPGAVDEFKNAVALVGRAYDYAKV